VSGGFFLGYIEDTDKAEVIPLAGGEAGIWQTISHMRGFAVSASADPNIRQAAESALVGIASRDWPAEARAIERWVRARLHYVRDGLNIETLKSPQRMLAEIRSAGLAVGDCDDASMLAAALLLAVGHRPAFQVLGRGKVPHHVNVLDTTGGTVVDPTGEPSGSFGYRKVYAVAG